MLKKLGTVKGRYRDLLGNLGFRVQVPINWVLGVWVQAILVQVLEQAFGCLDS